MKIPTSLSAPVMITWQLTYDCNLACLHCCTDSAPGRAMPGELSREEALGLAAQIAKAGIPYAMICGGEPTIVPHFIEVAEALGQAGVWLKIETNGQNLTPETARSLARLPVRSIQVSLDGATQGTYSRMRPGASLEKTLKACALIRSSNLPLEVTFAPAKFNIKEAAAVIDLAVELGAFRFNTGALMRLGRARKLWERVAPRDEDYAPFRELLDRKKRELAGRLEILADPFSIEEESASRLAAAASSGTMLVLPDGQVRLSGPIPFSVADLRMVSLLEAWTAFQKAWTHPAVLSTLRRLAAGDPSRGADGTTLHLPDLPAPQEAGTAA